MILNNEDILRRLLKEEGEQEQKPKEDEKSKEEPKSEGEPKGFEDDPMGFILNKYHTLSTNLENLLSSNYKEYITAIFIVAPKPTTFKVVLHNAQYFFMTYMGEGVYEATVAGKRYYLSELGVKEQAMTAISRLLRYGSPLNSKGPEGAEQGTRPDEGGSSGGGSTSSTGGGETEGESTGEEAGGTEETGGEESLQESTLLRHIILEAVKKIDLFDYIKSGLKDLGIKVERNGKHGKHLRGQITNTNEVSSTLEKIMNSLSKEKFYKIEEISVGDFSSGAKSGTYNTTKVTVTDPKALENTDVSYTEPVYFVNQIREKSKIVAKSLTPDKFYLTGKTFSSGKSLAKDIISDIPQVTSDKNLQEALSNLIKDISNKTKTKFEKVKDISEASYTVELSDNTVRSMEKYSQVDLNIIGKDFGEILGAISLANSVSSLEFGIKFPRTSNNPLADFYVDGYAISSKYQKGADATLTAIIKDIDPEDLSKSQKKLYEIFDIVINNTAVEGYIKTANAINAPGLNALAKILKVKKESITPQAIETFLSNILKKAKTKKEKDNILVNTFSEFYLTIGRSPDIKKLDWDKIESGKLYGVITSPLAYHVADVMNENKSYVQSLRELLSKIEVKQMYFDFSIGKKQASFNIKSFSSPNSSFKFTAGVSAYNPSNATLKFKLL